MEENNTAPRSESSSSSSNSNRSSSPSSNSRGGYNSRGPSSGGGGRYNKKKFFRKKECYFKTNNIKIVDYKDIALLKRFVTARGKILPRRITGTSAKYQRVLVRAIKKARYLALLPYEKK